MAIHRDLAEEAATLTALRLDFEMMLMEPAGAENSTTNGSDPVSVPQPAPRRTNSDKRADVLAILAAHPELSDREIARRAGVSPQTVNTHRRQASAAASKVNKCEHSGSVG
ncbi:winged helix-turn-helix domain-containing protein [Xanthobacter oligotrophicus]|uniref:winged helix-turn-helix domain-containing protein n=1 Tax=Xanthobacter oligotrophicus TaxID=2607286 RepID=UPI0011F1628E|nr:winged helix-turn-helix domain-containing protein [Xanthobacter oligotrophicus]